MKITGLLFLISVSFYSHVFCQEVIPLWEGQDKPYFKENDLQEYEWDAYGTRVVYNITEPTITVYPAKGRDFEASL